MGRPARLLTAQTRWREHRRAPRLLGAVGHRRPPLLDPQEQEGHPLESPTGQLRTAAAWIDQREVRGHPEPGGSAAARARECSADLRPNVLRAAISTALRLRRTNTPALRRSTAAAGALAARSTHHSGRFRASFCFPRIQHCDRPWPGCLRSSCAILGGDYGLRIATEPQSGHRSLREETWSRFRMRSGRLTGPGVLFRRSIRVGRPLIPGRGRTLVIRPFAQARRGRPALRSVLRAC